MKKISLIILFLSWCWPASAAAPCQAPSPYDGYSSTYPNIPKTIVTGMVYDLDNVIGWETMASGLVNWFFQVPSAKATSWANTKTPDQFYTSQISPSYHHGFLTESCNELISEDGKTYLWSM